MKRARFPGGIKLSGNHKEAIILKGREVYECDKPHGKASRMVIKLYLLQSFMKPYVL